MLIALDSRCILNVKVIEQLAIVPRPITEKIKTGKKFLGVELTETVTRTEYALRISYRDESNYPHVFNFTSERVELLEQALKSIVKQVKSYETSSINEAFEKALNGE